MGNLAPIDIKHSREYINEIRRRGECGGPRSYPAQWVPRASDEVVVVGAGNPKKRAKQKQEGLEDPVGRIPLNGRSLHNVKSPSYSRDRKEERQ